MAVLHIVWIILKLAGVLLLILLGLLVVLLLAVLFCPVVYQAQGSREPGTMEGTAKISWLFHLLSFQLKYKDKKTEYLVRIFGIPINRVMEFFSRRQEKKAKKRKKSKDEDKRKAEFSAAETKEEIKEEIKTETVTEKPEPQSVQEKLETPKRKTPGLFRKLGEMPGKILKSIKNFRLTCEGICGKIEEIKEFLQSEQFAGAKIMVFGELGKILKYIRPRKVRGLIKFGTEDPCITGEILGMAGIFYPLYGEYFTIEPYFDQNILEGNLFIRGRIQGIVFVVTAWRLFRDSDIRYIVKKFKQH